MPLFDTLYLYYILRIVLASVCGLLIGLERHNRAKEAGMRTHCIVACGAALMMIVSKYAFFDLISGEMFNGVEVRLDPSRIASTIASGIGFLGAGMIFVHKKNITGLTTAAGIWATSGVGMAIGSGMYVVGIAATIIIITVQVILHIRISMHKGLNIKKLVITDVDVKDFQAYICACMKEKNIRINNVTAEKNYETGLKGYTFTLELPSEINEDNILEFVDYNCKII